MGILAQHPPAVTPETTLKASVHTKVDWFRPHWTYATSPKSRVFFRRHHALNFLDTLKKRGPLLWWRIQVRDASVTKWRVVKSGGRS